MRDDVLIDGIAASPAWLDERSCQYGDGVFETVAIVDGGPCLWAAHMARLAEGCKRLYLPVPDIDVVSAECRTLAADIPRGVLKVYLTAGDSQRGYRRSQPLQPRRILRCIESPESVSSRAWRVRICHHRLSKNPTLAGIKHLNRLDQVIARAEWDDDSADEGIMLGQDGTVVSGTMSNLFVQKRGALYTPPIEDAGIAGVVRKSVLQFGAGGVSEMPLNVDELRTADALYLTNSLIGVVRVASFVDTDFDLSIPEHPALIRARDRCHQPDRLS